MGHVLPLLEQAEVDRVVGWGVVDGAVDHSDAPAREPDPEVRSVQRQEAADAAGRDAHHCELRAGDCVPDDCNGKIRTWPRTDPSARRATAASFSAALRTELAVLVAGDGARGVGVPVQRRARREQRRAHADLELALNDPPAQREDNKPAR